MLARRTHTFRHLAMAINDSFARWDLAHLHVFDLADGSKIVPLQWWDDPDGDELDDRTTRLSRLQLGERSPTPRPRQRLDASVHGRP